MTRPDLAAVDSALLDARVWVRELSLEIFRLRLLGVKRSNGQTVEQSLAYVESVLGEIVDDVKSAANAAGRSA
jgi:hypothetical protein